MCLLIGDRVGSGARTRGDCVALGGGGNGLPEIVIICCGMHGGGHGGTSRMTKGSGVHGLGGC